MLDKLCLWWNKYNPFDIEYYFTEVKNSVEALTVKLDNVACAIDNKMASLTSELSMCRNVLYTVGDTLPDMMWFKDINGVYLYANKAIKTKLLFDMHPLGKTDAEMAVQAKKYFGDRNHTFGEKCSSSDKVVLETLKPQRFLESGKLEGKTVYLEVFKAPVIVEDKVIGVCGTGRDMTEYVEAYRGDDCSKCSGGRMNDIFKKYEYMEEE